MPLHPAQTMKCRACRQQAPLSFPVICHACTDSWARCKSHLHLRRPLGPACVAFRFCQTCLVICLPGWLWAITNLKNLPGQPVWLHTNVYLSLQMQPLCCKHNNAATQALHGSALPGNQLRSPLCRLTPSALPLLKCCLWYWVLLLVS